MTAFGFAIKDKFGDILIETVGPTKRSAMVNWLYVQIRQKHLLMDRQPSGAYLFENTASVIDGIGSSSIAVTTS